MPFSVPDGTSAGASYHRRWKRHHRTQGIWYALISLVCLTGLIASLILGGLTLGVLAFVGAFATGICAAVDLAEFRYHAAKVRLHEEVLRAEEDRLIFRKGGQQP